MENPKSSAKNPTQREEPITIDPKQKTADPIVESGWNHYEKKEYAQAIDDFRKALDIVPDNIDVLYALGMTLHAKGDHQEAIATFQQVIQALENTPEINRTRAVMLIRLAHGHINRMQTGDWHLNK